MAREADERPATSRRDFLGAGLLGGALAAARPLLGGEPWAQGAAGSGAAGPGGEGDAGAAAGPAAPPPTAGSLALAGSVPARDAFVARRLRDAGAVLLGKTNLSEWANFRSTHSSSGWSGRGGQCRNPYALDRCPSGSSSGSAAAAAANLCVAAIGTETDGSIVSPAGHCCLVGIKPTVGLLSRAGIVPIAHSQDTPGPMARTVTDAALLLAAMAGFDPDDPVTAGAGHAFGSVGPGSGDPGSSAGHAGRP